MEDQIRPIDWANEHGVETALVVRLLREHGVMVRTQVSRINASEYKKIEAEAKEPKTTKSCANRLRSSRSRSRSTASAMYGTGLDDERQDEREHRFGQLDMSYGWYDPQNDS